MNEPLYSAELNPGNIVDTPAKLEDFRYFIREDRELDLAIREKFPINYFGNDNDKLCIKGTKLLVDKFEEIYSEKIDIFEKLENITYIGLSDKNQIILHFNNDFDTSASGVYDFSYDFCEELFSMGKYFNYCLKEEYEDLIKENINELIVKQKDVEKQYRLIKKNDIWFIRGLTSNRYNNYDNNIAIYLSLLFLNQYAKNNNINYKLVQAYLNDSSIQIVLEQEKLTVIDNLGKVHFGVIIRNSEIRESTLSIEIKYRIVDSRNSAISFSAIPALKDSVLNLMHGTGITRMEEKIQDLSHIKEIQESMLNFIRKLSGIEKLSEDAIYSILKEITNSRNFKAATKQKFRELYDKNLVNNTLSLIETFNVIDTITTDIDEKIFLERIYHKVIMMLTNIEN